jgi:dUTP pyrophosphatase
MKLKVRKLTITAKAPSRATDGSSGYDIYSDEDITIDPLSRSWVSTGIAIELPNERDYTVGYARGYSVGQVWPRSGMAGRGIDTSAGVIDMDYRGELKVLLVNSNDKKENIKSGMRIAQLLIIPVLLPAVEVVDSLSDTFRGSNGFGSSGA